MLFFMKPIWLLSRINFELRVLLNNLLFRMLKVPKSANIIDLK